MILVDSSIYIDLLRSRRDPQGVLTPYLRAGWLRICEVIRFEVLRGIVSQEYRAQLREFFDLIPALDLTPAVWRRAVDVGSALDRKGEVLPLTDLVIAACALENRTALVSTDRHFSRIPKLKLWNTLPSSAIAYPDDPAGS